MPEYRNIRVDVSESIATLTIDRPAVKNALNLETVEECRKALEALAADAAAGALIITGAGESAFVSGADINDIRARGREEGLAAINSSLFAEIERFPRPTIAAINGTPSAAAASWRWRATSASRPTPRSSASRSWGWGSFPGPAPRSGFRGSSGLAGRST